MKSLEKLKIHHNEQNPISIWFQNPPLNSWTNYYTADLKMADSRWKCRVARFSSLFRILDAKWTHWLEIFFWKVHFLKFMTVDLESNLHPVGDNGKTPIDLNRSGLHPQSRKWNYRMMKKHHMAYSNRKQFHNCGTTVTELCHSGIKWKLKLSTKLVKLKEV